MSTPDASTPAVPATGADHDADQGTPHGTHQDALLPASVRSGLLSMRVLLPGDPGWVWQHLTRPELLTAWSPVVPDRVLDAVGPARTAGTPDAAAVDASVLEVLDGFRLVHRWGAEELIWQLAPHGEDTQLQLVHRLSHPDDHASAAVHWHRHLRRLEAVLRGDVQAAGSMARRDDDDDALRQRYAAAITVNNADN